MANFFVDSAAVADGLGGGNTGTAANPWLSLGSAVSGGGVAAGDNIFVAATHAESAASAFNYTNPGTPTSPCFIYCVPAASFAGPPATGDLTTGGSVTTTGNNTITLSGSYYCYGLIFSCGSGANSVSYSFPGNNGNTQVYEACAMRLGGTSGGNIAGAASGVALTFINTTIQVASTASSLAAPSGFIWKNTASAFTGATFPNVVISSLSRGPAFLEGVDLSALSGKNLLTSLTTNVMVITLKDCKLPASFTLADTETVFGLPLVDLIRCDSGATNYRNERHAGVGSQTTDIAIVRTGGASDGTTTISWKIVTNAGSKWVFPFISQPISIWNDTTGSKTVTVYGTTTGGGVPNNDDIWIEVEYLGSSATPQGSFTSTTKANNLAASTTTNNSSDSSTWSGGGAGNGFKMVTPSFTTNMKGPITVTVKVADNSATYYIDPLVVVS